MGDIIDRVDIAIATGHGAAVNLLTAMNPDGDAGQFENWPSLGMSLDIGRDPVLELGRYICGKAEHTAGETLFRKAAELDIHERDASSWPEAKQSERLAYDLFAFVTRTVFDRLAPHAAPDLAAPAAPPAIEETIFERLEGGGDRDEHRVAALEAPAPKPKRAPRAKAPPAPGEDQEPQQPAEPAPGEQQPPQPAPAPADAAPLSIGEAPLDPAKQAKKPHGGRRTRKADKADA